MRYTNEDLQLRAEKIIQKLKNKLKDDDVKVKVKIINSKKEKTWLHQFPLKPEKTYIMFHISHVETYDKPSMRDWDAYVIVTFLHEYAHFWEFRSLSKKQKLDDDQKYKNSNRYRGDSELRAWIMTVDLLNKLRLHRSKTIRKVFSWHALPKNFLPHWNSYD